MELKDIILQVKSGFYLSDNEIKQGIIELGSILKELKQRQKLNKKRK